MPLGARTGATGSASEAFGVQCSDALPGKAEIGCCAWFVSAYMANAMALGDVATWVAAVGTVGTFSVSLALLYRADTDRRMAQARLTSAWMAEMTHGPGRPELTYLIRNDSQQPVYDLQLKAMCGVRGTFVRWIGTLGPTETRELKIRLPGYPRASEYQPAITFVDSAGRRWLRDEHGKLAQPTTTSCYDTHARALERMVRLMSTLRCG
jgi:hypothetical protein